MSFEKKDYQMLTTQPSEHPNDACIQYDLLSMSELIRKAYDHNDQIVQTPTFKKLQAEMDAVKHKNKVLMQHERKLKRAADRLSVAISNF